MWLLIFCLYGFQFRVLNKAVKCMQISSTISIRLFLKGFWVMDFQLGSSLMWLKLGAISNFCSSINRCQHNTGHLYPNTKIASIFIHCNLQRFFKPFKVIYPSPRGPLFLSSRRIISVWLMFSSVILWNVERQRFSSVKCDPCERFGWSSGG